MQERATSVMFESDATGAVPVAALSAHEAMNELGAWRATLDRLPESFDPDALVGGPARLVFEDRAEGAKRVVPLVVTEVSLEGLSEGGTRAVVEMAAPEWPRTLRRCFRVWVGKTTQEIVTDVLGPSARLVWRLSGTYSPRPQCVEYGEEEWPFVARLLADEGICHWFDVDEEGEPRIVFGDDAGSHEGIEGEPRLVLRDVAGVAAGRAFHELEVEDRRVFGAVHVRDFDVGDPEVLVEGRAGSGAEELFEYPARVPTQDSARRRAEVRLEQLGRDERVATGGCDCVRLVPGRLLDVEGCVDDDANARWLVVELEHTWGAGNYRSRARMVPATRTWRPSPPASPPRATGVDVAFTTGAAGEEIHVDPLGRVKLRMPWDRSGVIDDRSSAWARSLQPALGGSMLLPRVGWEVAVAYMYGDPDAPVVLGRVYNATAVVPYGLPGAAATTTLQSATSPGGAGTNELRMVDTAGRQQVFLHATKDQSVRVGGDATTAVAGNETLDVGLSQGTSVGGSHAHAVGASQSVSVKTGHTLVVTGGRSETVGALEHVKVLGDRELVALAFRETVGALSYTQCNQSNVGVEGNLSETVGVAGSLAAASGVVESVGGSRTESVGGMRLISVQAYGEEVVGDKRLTAGAAVERAGGKVVTFTKADGTVLVGGAWSAHADGPLAISADTITMQVGGALTAGALSLSGGKLSAKSGGTKLKGTIKRKGTTKLL